MTAIRLIVGLGNPGSQHQHDRHNAGYRFVDGIAGAYGGRWRSDPKFFGDAARVRIGDADVWLLKPLTWMNRSGQAVAALARFYKIAPPEMLVAFDELDLSPGTIKLKRGGGSGGHNGVKDVALALSSQDFWRLRIGIGHPRQLAPGREVVDFVLQRPSRDEALAIDERVPEAHAVVPLMVAGEWERAGQRLHTPPAPRAPQ